jgi:chemotaxis-related protein WspB
MLALLFSIGDDRYGLPVAAVVEVTPVLRLKKMPGAPDYVAGLCNFRGQAIPVLDISALARGVPSRPVLSTRMIVVDYPLEQGGVRQLGLLAERATETAAISEADLRPAGVQVDEAPFLGKVAISSGEMVQLIEVGQLLTQAVVALLFQEEPVE